MHTTRPITLIATLFFAATAVAQENVDAVKQRIVLQAQSLSADDYAFTRTSRTEGVSNGKAEKRVMVEKFDPTKAGAARWTLVSVDGASPSADALSRYNKESAKRRVPGYYRLASYFGAAATSSKDSRGRTVFRFESLPKDTVVIMDSDVSQNASADLTVGEANGVPFVEQVRISVKPTRIKLVMKLQRLELTSRYRMGPEGNPLATEATQEMAGSGLGQEGTMRTTTTYGDFRPIRGGG